MYSAPPAMFTGDQVGTGTPAFRSCSLRPRAHLGTQGSCPGRRGGCFSPWCGMLGFLHNKEGER